MADTVTKTGVAKGQRTFYGLIVDAIVNLKQPKGCSRQSILDYLFATNKLKDSRQTRRSVVQSIERNIRNGSLVKVGKTSYIKLAEKACGFKEIIKRTGKGNKTSIAKKNCVKGKNTGEEKNKRKQPAKTRVSAKPSETDASTKHRKHEKVTGIRRSRNTLGTPKQAEKKDPTKRNKGRKETKTKENTVKQRKKSRTGTNHVEQKTKKAKSKNQRKTVLSPGKTKRGQKKSIGSKTKA